MHRMHNGKAATWPEKDARSVDKVLGAVVVVLIAATFCLLPWMLRRGNGDIHFWYLPWYEHIVQHGRWASLEASYANYNPPYLYLLSLASLLHRWVSPVAIIKLAQVPGLLLSGLMAGLICRAVGQSSRRSILAGCLIAAAPEPVANALLWGQCDMLYTAFLLLMLRMFLSKRWNWGMAALGVAVAIKLQAALVGPTILVLLLVDELPLSSIVWAIASYVLLMVPAWIAGRPWRQLLLIYRSQMSTYPEIAMNVANPYQLLEHWVRSQRASEVVNRLGMFVALAVVAAIVWFLMRPRRRFGGERLIAALALPLLIEPYVLPKMHDRYYLPGNVLLLILAAINPRMFVPAAFTQAAALCVYYRFLRGEQYDPHFYVIPVLLISVAVVMFLREYGPSLFSMRRSWDATPAAEAAQ